MALVYDQQDTWLNVILWLQVYQVLTEKSNLECPADKLPTYQHCCLMSQPKICFIGPQAMTCSSLVQLVNILYVQLF